MVAKGTTTRAAGNNKRLEDHDATFTSTTSQSKDGNNTSWRRGKIQSKSPASKMSNFGSSTNSNTSEVSYAAIQQRLRQQQQQSAQQKSQKQQASSSSTDPVVTNNSKPTIKNGKYSTMTVNHQKDKANSMESSDVTSFMSAENILKNLQSVASLGLTPHTQCVTNSGFSPPLPPPPPPKTPPPRSAFSRNKKKNEPKDKTKDLAIPVPMAITDSTIKTGIKDAMKTISTTAPKNDSEETKKAKLPEKDGKPKKADKNVDQSSDKRSFFKRRKDQPSRMTRLSATGAIETIVFKDKNGEEKTYKGKLIKEGKGSSRRMIMELASMSDDESDESCELNSLADSRDESTLHSREHRLVTVNNGREGIETEVLSPRSSIQTGISAATVRGASVSTTSTPNTSNVNNKTVAQPSTKTTNGGFLSNLLMAAGFAPMVSMGPPPSHNNEEYDTLYDFTCSPTSTNMGGAGDDDLKLIKRVRFSFDESDQVEQQAEAQQEQLVKSAQEQSVLSPTESQFSSDNRSLLSLKNIRLKSQQRKEQQMPKQQQRNRFIRSVSTLSIFSTSEDDENDEEKQSEPQALAQQNLHDPKQLQEVTSSEKKKRDRSKIGRSCVLYLVTFFTIVILGIIAAMVYFFFFVYKVDQTAIEDVPAISEAPTTNAIIVPTESPALNLIAEIEGTPSVSPKESLPDPDALGIEESTASKTNPTREDRLEALQNAEPPPPVPLPVLSEDEKTMNQLPKEKDLREESSTAALDEIIVSKDADTLPEDSSDSEKPKPTPEENLPKEPMPMTKEAPSDASSVLTPEQKAWLLHEEGGTAKAIKESPLPDEKSLEDKTQPEETLPVQEDVKDTSPKDTSQPEQENTSPSLSEASIQEFLEENTSEESETLLDEVPSNQSTSDTSKERDNDMLSSLFSEAPPPKPNNEGEVNETPTEAGVIPTVATNRYVGNRDSNNSPPQNNYILVGPDHSHSLFTNEIKERSRSISKGRQGWRSSGGRRRIVAKEESNDQ